MESPEPEEPQKSMMEAQKDLTENAFEWYKTTFQILEEDSWWLSISKVLARIIITTIMVVMSPFIAFSLLIALMFAG